MPEFDLLIRGAQPLGEIGIANGKFAGFRAGSAREEIDATGLLVLPGVVDAHVHFNEPGRTDWEGWKTGSRAAVAGGITTVCDMPLNSTPPVIDTAALHAKIKAALGQSTCEFALWGGLVPGSLNHLKPLAEAGVIGFKAFMSHSGIDAFPKADLATLGEGMARAAELNLPVAVHAEIDREIPARGESVTDYLASRPIAMELEAIEAALEIARVTGCALHVVHVSSGRGVALIAEARARGVNVTCETCPHYLIFTGDDMIRLGAVAKCAPPMRNESERLALWENLRAGRIQTIGSDHSPSPWNLKARENFFEVWGGISGIQHLAPVLLDAGLDSSLFAAVAARNPAERFRLGRKGKIELGADADLFLLDPKADYEVTAESLFYRHQHSPHVGRRLRARVRRTILRGKTIFQDGEFIGHPAGQFLKPL